MTEHTKPEKHISQFVGHFRGQIQVVKNATFSENAETYRKALYCSIIDALATTMGANSKHREKFTQAVRDYGNWPDHSRISRPHLEKLLSRTNDSCFEAVHRALTALPPFPSYAIMPIAGDPEYAIVEALWPVGSNSADKRLKKINGIDCLKLRHDQLLYSLRNKLVHESRTYGTANPLPFQNNPYYHRIISFDTDAQWWTLNYPSSFVENLATNVLNGLDKYYRTNMVDPYDFFDYGDYWFTELNVP